VKGVFAEVYALPEKAFAGLMQNMQQTVTVLWSAI